MSTDPPPDWIHFLHRLGVEIHRLSGSRTDPFAVFVSVPFLDFAGVLTVSGILAGKYRYEHLPSSDPHEWLDRKGQPVSFPVELRDGKMMLKRWVGSVHGVDEGPEGPCLAVTYLDNMQGRRQGRHYTRFVKPRWLPAVCELETMPDLDTWHQGSRLVSNIGALDKLLGKNGSAALVGQGSQDCLMIDVKTRVIDELKDSIDLQRFGVSGADESLVLADLIRPDGWGPEAMRETFSSRVTPEPAPGWRHTVLCGSLNFLRCWDEIDSPVRVVFISASENAYTEAVDFVNELYYQRIEEIPLPGDLLALKPSSFDIQLISCKE
ncbi:hypothetical protein HAHE_15580 [Haloferula helveola]|uniref:Uncharacterized protein n=1 Tax=Haloferula helveola TaxID=490095 RepID=A0ABM7RC74_9BACT|nr:hypothetical protein HAHE_15580 [Haloferula helveola]